MKKIYFALFAIIVMMASGCEGFLDENPKSAFIGVEAYSNPKLVYINCVASLYVPATIPNLSEFDQVLYYFDNCAADMVITPAPPAVLCTAEASVPPAILFFVCHGMPFFFAVPTAISHRPCG